MTWAIFDSTTVATRYRRFQQLHILQCLTDDCTTYRKFLGFRLRTPIIEYEKLRVGRKYESHIVHVAMENVSAGYDIRSLSLMPNDKAVSRYIEVKAVPLDSYRFYWTSNERRVANLLKGYYFLYLLPVNYDNSFSLEKLKIIQDPITGILAFPDIWFVETDLVKCSLIESIVHAE